MAARSLFLLIGLTVLTVTLLIYRPANERAAPAPATAEATEMSAEATEAATAEATAESTGSSAGLVGDPVRGQLIFEHGMNGAPPCSNCHATSGTTGRFALAPSLMGLSERAATRIAGMSASRYVEDSIRHPTDYLVPGFRPIMYGMFGEDYSDQEIADLIAYVLTL